MVFPCTWSSRLRTSSNNTWAFLVARTVKNLPARQEAQVRPLSWEDPLEKGMATHSTILAWRIPWTEEPGGLQPTRLQRVRHDWATNTQTIFCNKNLDHPEGSLRENGYKYTYGWVPLLLTWNYYNIVNQLLLLLSHFSCVRLCATP